MKAAIIKIFIFNYLTKETKFITRTVRKEITIHGEGDNYTLTNLNAWVGFLGGIFSHNTKFALDESDQLQLKWWNAIYPFPILLCRELFCCIR